MSDQQKDQQSDSAADKKPLHQADTKKNPPATGDSSPAETRLPGETQPMAAYDAPEAGGPLPEIDEGPPAQPVDDIQETLLAARQQGTSADIDFDRLPKPQLDLGLPSPQPSPSLGMSEEELLDLDEGPSPQPVDDIQGALFEAGRQGVSPEIPFEKLPPPQLPGEPRKKISRPVRPETSPVAETAADTPPRHAAPDTVPLPDFPTPPSSTTTSDYWLILILFVSFRALTLFLLRPGGYIRDWSDFDTYLGIASLSDYDLFPFFDFWLEWPPLVPWLAVGAYRLSLWLPAWPDDPRLWFILILGGVFLLFEIGNFLLIGRLARRLWPVEAHQHRVLWLYAGLFPPIYAMLGFFDGVALFFILLSLELLFEDQRFPSAIAAGLGFLVKIIPALILPLALQRLWQRYRENPREAVIEMGLYAVAFGLTIVILLLPFLIGGPEWVAASARSMAGRSSWETVWAVLEGYYGFGVVDGDRLNPAETAFAISASSSPDWLFGVQVVRAIFGLVLGSLYLLALLQTKDDRPRPLIALAGLTLAFFMLYSKGYSPQFLIYLLPFIILLYPNARGLTYTLVLTGLNVLEQPIYFVFLPQTTWLLTFIVTARFVVTLLLAVEFALTLWPEAAWTVRLATLRPRLPLALGGLAAATLVILTPVLLRAYAAGRLTDSPGGTLAGFIQAVEQNPADLANCPLDPPPTRLFLSDQATYRQLTPHLRDSLALRLAAGAPAESDVPSPGQLLPESGLAWLLANGPHGPTLSRAAERQGRALATYTFADLGQLALYTFSTNGPAPACQPLARLNPGVELLAHHIERNRGQVTLTLYWRATSVQSQNLTVFTQLLNSSGQQVAGHDSLPRNGSDPLPTWPVETVQADPHAIQLPSNLPPGEYQLIAGLYNDTGQRMRAIAPSGFNYANQAITLGTISLR